MAARKGGHLHLIGTKAEKTADQTASMTPNRVADCASGAHCRSIAHCGTGCALRVGCGRSIDAENQVAAVLLGRIEGFISPL